MNQLITFLFVSILSVSIIGCSSNETYKYKNGDIILQTSKSSQSKMIQEVTNSKYSHVGIVYVKDGKPYVFEAVQPVKISPLNEFINRGVDSKYTVVRYNREFNEDQMNRMYNYATSQIGKNYDLKFEWSDNSMYCSELVFKIYYNAGITLCNINKFSDYDLNSNEVQNAINERYDNKINLNEDVVTPVDLYESLSVHTVFDNY